MLLQVLVECLRAAAAAELLGGRQIRGRFPSLLDSLIHFWTPLNYKRLTEQNHSLLASPFAAV